MKKILPVIALATLVSASFGSCKNDDKDTWEVYADWREFNNDWLTQQQKRTNPDGTPYYTTIVPKVNPNAYVLVHYFNDRKLTEGNLSPLYTSTVDVRYEGYLADSTMFDSSTNVTEFGQKGIYRTTLGSVIQGWGIVLQDMHVGDTCEVLIPYASAYGSQSSGLILPYSNLRFNIRLADIYRYEASPKI